MPAKLPAPVEPTEPLDPAGSTEPVESLGPAGSTEPVESLGPAGSTGPVESTGPTQSNRRSESPNRWLFSGRWMLSHLFVLLMVVIMVNLGFWQTRRLEERQEQNNEIRAALEAAPQEIEALLEFPMLPPDHTSTVAVGSYLDEHSFLVANRTYETEPGNWLVTPLKLTDGTVVVVSRGWVPRLWAAGVRSDDLSAPDGEVMVLGRAFSSVGGGDIGTDDIAVLTELNRLDLNRAEELTGLELAGLWVQLEQQQLNGQRLENQPAPGALPIPVPPADLDDGPHLSYAFQWFFFSAGALVVYGIILMRRHREPLRAALNRY